MTLHHIKRTLGAIILFFPLQVQAQVLPPGEGRDLVEANCTGCHGTGNISRSLGYTAEGWKQLALTMVYLDGTPELDTIAAYLAEHFPPNVDRAPVSVDGPLPA